MEPPQPEARAHPMNNAALVLIAEDEPEIVDILKAYLRREGLRTAWAANGRAALDMHQALKPDLLLLDVQMPQVDGWRVLSEVRTRATTPVIMVTAHDQDIDKLMALRVGADDYVVKPFNPAEVAARVQAVLRRSRGKDETPADVLRIGTLEIDLEAFHARINQAGVQHPLPLPLTEFRLLAHLARAPRRVFSRGELITACLSSEGGVLERTVDSHMSKLRKKLEDAGLPGVPVSLRGVGYRLEEVA